MTDAQTGVVSTMGLRNNDANKLKLQPHYMLGHSQISVWIRYSETTMKQGCMYIVQCTRMCIYVCALQALSDLHFKKKLQQNSPLRCVYKPDRKDSFLAIPVRVPDTTSSSKMKSFPHCEGQKTTIQSGKSYLRNHIWPLDLLDLVYHTGACTPTTLAFF